MRNVLEEIYYQLDKIEILIDSMVTSTMDNAITRILLSKHVDMLKDYVNDQMKENNESE